MRAPAAKLRPAAHSPEGGSETHSPGAISGFSQTRYTSFSKSCD